MIILTLQIVHQFITGPPCPGPGLNGRRVSRSGVGFVPRAARAQGRATRALPHGARHLRRNQGATRHV